MRMDPNAWQKRAAPGDGWVVASDEKPSEKECRTRGEAPAPDEIMKEYALEPSVVAVAADPSFAVGRDVRARPDRTDATSGSGP